MVHTLDCHELIAHHPVRIYTDAVSSLDVLADRLADTQALVLLRERTSIGEALLECLPRLALPALRSAAASHRQ